MKHSARLIYMIRFITGIITFIISGLQVAYVFITIEHDNSLMGIFAISGLIIFNMSAIQLIWLNERNIE